MWLDRFSAQSTPSGSPPPPPRRSYSPAGRPGHLGPPSANRPTFSPRTSSLALGSKANASTSSLNSPRLPNGSGLKHELIPPPEDVDPLKALASIVGKPLKREMANGEANSKEQKLTITEEEILFDGSSLQDFAYKELGEDNMDAHHTSQNTEEYEKEKDNFEDLHRSILACDEVLKSVEASLTSFQNDLGIVSAEIETLQARSTAINAKLENRKVVEKMLGPTVEEISIAPAVITKISDDKIDQSWMMALEDLEKRIKAVELKAKGPGTIHALSDVKPILNDLTSKAIERIRDFLVSQIKSLRSPNINAQIIQQQGFLKHKDLFSFLARHHTQLAEEISQAYVNTMRWYYLHHFTRYRQALDKITLFTVDKQDALGTDPQLQRAAPSATRPPQVSSDALNLGRRMDILKSATRNALPSHLAEESRVPANLETPFHAFNVALIDNATFEYTFLTTFFASSPMQSLSQKFTSIFSPTFALGESLTHDLIDHTYDCVGLLLCVRLNQCFAFELQRRKCPGLDGYINGTNMLLWPRFQLAMDMHCESIRRASTSLSSGRAGLSLTSASATSTAPHPLTQRFGSFLQAILALSSDAPDSNEPVANSLGRLRGEIGNFLEKAAKGFGADRAKRERFLKNQWSLVLTIIGDTRGKLAEEVKGAIEFLGGD